jgi:hypothetical protein
LQLLVSPSVLLWETSTEKTCLGKGPVTGKDEVSTQEVKEIIQRYSRPLCDCRKSNSLDANPQIQLISLHSSETNVKDVKAFRASLSKRDACHAYDALLTGGMGELLLDHELTPLANEIEKCGQNAAEQIILVYEGKHRGEV